MALFPCTDAAARSSALQAAANALAPEIQYLPAGHPLIQTTADYAKSMTQVLAAATSGTDVCDLLNASIESLSNLSAQVALVTGRADVAKVWLDPYRGSPWRTLAVLTVLGLGGYFLYKWYAQPEDYPRRLAPRYAGGSRRL